MLQLASAIIGDAEFMVRQTIASVITWAVMTWLTAQLLAPASGGASTAAALAKITSESARSANLVKRLIDRVVTSFRRIAALFKRMMATLAKLKREGFEKLKNSAWGKKFVDYPYSAPYFRNAILKDAGHKGRHVKIGNADVGLSIAGQARRAPINQSLLRFGFNRFWNDKQGNTFKPARMVVSPIRMVIKGGDSFYAWPIVGARILQTVFPFGRVFIYWRRSEDGPDVMKF
jgi:hypothetical protein